ncbi:MAG TPA: outer membrane protein assembly factor BamB [Rubrivivax sp.]|nr:outer membrane protein assembly factor BamB [Rubrivivax sp.]
MTLRTLALLGAVLLLGACAADKPKPTPLENYPAKIAGKAVWSTRLNPSILGLASSREAVLIPAVRDGRVLVAAAEGEVAALAADSGAVLWRASVGGPISAGLGSDGRFISVVTRGNEVVTFDGQREAWRKRVPASAVTPPLVAGERVFVMTVDRAVHAFDAIDGRRLWTLQRPGDALTLAQPGVLSAVRNTLLVGQGAKLAGVDPTAGTVQWEIALASPRGTNEVERLADLVGPAVRLGDRVCARAFQSAVACADGAKGVVLWSRSVGGANAVAMDNELVFGADASDRIAAWRVANGDVAWSSEKLLYRGLSGALAVGPVVVFGDSQGYVHFLSTATGEQQLRLPTDGSPIVGPPVLAGNTLIVSTQGGGLFAFRPN